MSPPAVRVNTFVGENVTPPVDTISKMFIVSEMILGLNRLSLMGGRRFIYVYLPFIIHIIWTTVILYASLTSNQPMTVMGWTKIFQNNVSVLLGLIRCKFLLSFYNRINTFDTEAACKLKTPTSCVWNLVQAGVTIFIIIGIYTIFSAATLMKHRMSLQFMPLNMLYVLEVHYYGHLLNLLVPRLKLINYCIESSLLDAKQKPQTTLKEVVYVTNKEKVTHCHMRKLMNLYELIDDAFEFMIEGIKWQLAVIIITSFISILGFLYTFTLVAIRSGEALVDYAILQTCMIVTLIAPLFAPCICSDHVHGEVKKLRELLSSKLYENKLDKSGRSAARALLAITETRDLSFRLLRMLNIDVSLPFKFFGLLVTYLIILLQFEKVIYT